jgi:hypothetical protein
VAKVEGESFNFDDLELPDVESAAAELDAEPAAAAESDVAPAQVEGEPVESEVAEEKEELAEEPELEKHRKFPVNLEWVGVIGAAVILLALAWFGLLLFPTACYVVSVGLVAYAVWRGRQSNSVFTVLLACALVAILTAIYCLWLEVGRYQYDVKARDAKQRVSTLLPAEDPVLAHAGTRLTSES